MKMVKKSVALILALILFVFPCVMAFPAHAIALDPVSFLYPIWQAFGASNGLSIVNAGGNSFTQKEFPMLFAEWQSYRVSSGLQETVQSLSEWVESIKSYISVAPSVVSMGVLNSALRLESNVVMPLTEFWNYIIKYRLGGITVDTVNFDQGTGNLALASPPVMRLPYYDGTNPIVSSAGIPIYIYSGTSYRFGFVTDESVYIYGFCYADPDSGHPYRVQSVIISSEKITGASGKAKMYSAPLSFQTPYNATFRDLTATTYDSSRNLYYGIYTSYSSPGFDNLPDFDSFTDGMNAAATYLADPSFLGSITVSPQVGVSELGFDDASDQDYVPSDAVIPWNIPYDQAATRDDYLERAYEKALDNTLTDVVGSVDTPVEGTGTVGSVENYLAPNLADVFPFCIPFDIYNFLSLLAADPEAPRFTCELAFPSAIGGTKEITIDFDTPTWNQLAMILRTFELLLFIVGLAYITREKMIRS